MRTDYENTVYTIGALTVLIERDETPLADQVAMTKTRRELLARVPQLLDDLHASGRSAPMIAMESQFDVVMSR